MTTAEILTEFVYILDRAKEMKKERSKNDLEVLIIRMEGLKEKMESEAEHG